MSRDDSPGVPGLTLDFGTPYTDVHHVGALGGLCVRISSCPSPLPTAPEASCAKLTAGAMWLKYVNRLIHPIYIEYTASTHVRGISIYLRLLSTLRRHSSRGDQPTNPRSDL